MSLIPFKPCSTFCIVGCTGSGKTYWVRSLLQNLQDMFETAPVSVMYCYSVHQKLFQDMENEFHSFINFHNGLPSQEEIEEFSQDGIHRLIILDDLMTEVTKSQTIQDLFCVFCHHKCLSVIFISQNLYQQGKNARGIGLNTHYYVLLKNMRNRSQIAHLGRELFPKNPKILLESYEDCMKEPYGYLVVDISPHSDDAYRLRSHVFPGEDPVIYRVPQ